MHHGWLRAMALFALLGLLPIALIAHESSPIRHDLNPAPFVPLAPPAGDRTDLLVEGFEDAWPPAGWAIIQLGDSYTWARTPTQQNSGSFSAWVHYGSTGVEQDEYLVTPAIDLTGHASVFLEFYETMQYWPVYGGHHYIGVSTDSQTDPADFTMLVDWTPDNHEIPPDFGGDPITIDLSDYIGEPEVYIAFRYVGDYADDWFIDDVRVYEPFDHDINVVSVLPDGDQFEAPFALTPRVIVENIGQNPDTAEVRLQINESGISVYDEIVSVELVVTQRDTVDFPVLDLDPGHYYRLEASNLLPDDGNPANDQAMAGIDTYTQPHVPLGFMHTNAGSGPSAGADAIMDLYLEGIEPNSVSLVRVHTWWPNPADALYLANVEQSQALIYYNGFEYAPNELYVPAFWADGIADVGDDGPLYPLELEDRKLIHSPAVLSMHWLGDSEELVVRVDLLEPLDPTGDYRLHVVFTEDNVIFDGGNGYHNHQQAFRRIFPDMAGLTVSPVPGLYTEVIHCPLDPAWDFDELRAVVYLQDADTHRIWQSASDHLADLNGHVEIAPRISTVYEEDSFSIDLVIVPTDLGVRAVELEIDFDETYLQLDSIVPGDWLDQAEGSFWFYDYTPQPPDSALAIHFASSFLADATSADSGCVAKAYFTAKTFGESALPFTLAKVRDHTNTELNFSTSVADSIIVLPLFTGVGETPPGAMKLLGNAPNPFNPSTTIKYEIAEAGRYRLEVYDVSGRRLRTLADGPMTAGRHEAIWDGRDEQGHDLGSGVYFARLSGLASSRASKMVLLK